MKTQIREDIKEGSKVKVLLPFGGTIRGMVEEILFIDDRIDKAWVRLENGNPKLCRMADLTLIHE